MIQANGGDYTGNLDRSVTHLIVRQPTGRKYMAARRWKIHIVAPQWVEGSVQRGMILDEGFYDPHLPPEEIGKGAWVKRDVHRKSLGKRLREAATAQGEDGRRKLRKTASMKLSSQRENMWGQILGQQPSANQSGATLQAEEPTQPLPSDTMLRRPSESASHIPEVLDSFGAKGNSDTVFASCCFYIFGFPPRHAEMILPYITSREGSVVASLEQLASANSYRRFVIVLQDSNPKSHPLVPEGVEIVTEFFIEKCIHGKSSILPDPKAHVLGMPFPVFPIEGFTSLSISTTGFVDLELSQVERSIRQLGARYAERFGAECSMLICTSLGAARPQKLDLALMQGVPIVKADWLWRCISLGKKLPIEDFLFAELKSRAIHNARAPKPLDRSRSVSDINRKLTPKSLTGRPAASARVSLPGPDMSAFETTSIVATEPSRPISRARMSTKDSNSTSAFETAPTHQTSQKPLSQQIPERPASQSESRTLAEKSANDLNKTTSKDQTLSEASRKPLARVRSEVADSEGGDDEGLDIPGVEDDTVGLGVTERDDPAAVEKRRLEHEKAEKAAAERQALSSKLTSLLEGTVAQLGDKSFSSAASTVGVNDSGLFAAPPPPAAAGAARRKRKIIGRVVSNVSVVSNGSVSEESSGGLARTHSAVYHEDDSLVEEEPVAAGPTATPLEYDDPEATKSKARLMSRMLGRSSPGTDSKSEAHSSITMGAVHRAQEASSGKNAAGRSMRRR